MSPGRTSLAAAGVAAVVVAADQLARRSCAAGWSRGSSTTSSPGSSSSTCATPGIAFGFLSDGGALLVVGTAVALLALVFFFVTHTGRPLVWLPTGLLLGGAIGNVIDRAREGSVTDFVKFPHFPAFNVADMAITVGVLALIYVLEGPPRRRAESDAA